MNPKKSPIQQTQFAVLQSSVSVFVNKKTKQVDLKDIPLDIDYDVYFNDILGPYIYRVVMTIKGNAKKSVPGYVFTLKVGGEYQLSEELECTSKDYDSYVYNTGVACLINEARVYLQTLTAFFPFGAYIMPMIDMNDIMKQHYESKTQAEPQSDLEE